MVLYLQTNYNGTFSVSEKLEGAARDMFGTDYVELLTFPGDVPMATVYERVQTLYGCRKLILDF